MLKLLGSVWNFIPAKKWLALGGAVDYMVFRGRGTAAAGEALKETAAAAADPVKREALSKAVNEKLEGARAVGDTIVGGVQDPLGTLTGTSGTNPDGTPKKGILSRLFQDKDGSVNWMNTGLAALTAFWGGSKMGLFGGDDDKGGGLFGGGALKLGIMAVAGYFIFKNMDKIKEWFGKLTDGFNKKSSEIGGSNGQNIGIDPTGRFNLEKMDLGSATSNVTTPETGISSVVNNAAAPEAKPAATSQTPLGTEFSEKTKPGAKVVNDDADTSIPEHEFEEEPDLEYAPG